MARISPGSFACLMESDVVTIAIAQMDVQVARPEANLAQARRFAAQACDAGADLLLLPELWLHGYALDRAGEFAAPLGDGGFAQMAALSREFGLYVAGSTLERHAGGVSNTAAFYNPQGHLLGSYRKIHLFRLMHEDQYLVPGDCLVLCESPWGPIGLAICYDLRFPELFRTMALAGAVMFLIPAQWPVKRLDAWLTLARARAIENELFVAACNRAGRDGQLVFPGQSLVVDPLGKVLVSGSDQEQLLLARADMRQVPVARRYLTVYEDRRPETYHLPERALGLASGE
ncbi:MAG: carbon-nitrogen family hydrolase [Anaerolineae bacterium]|nr:carbon-nitrogen family hydrolase [Anaerolineae bacterium]